jgi:DNA helicase-2/ATP-dependent DNA helicase PcrA
LAYLRLLLQPHDTASFLRVANVPPRGVGPAAMAALQLTARERGISLWDASAALLDEGFFSGRTAAGLSAFRRHRDLLAAEVGSLPLGKLVARTLKQTGLRAPLEAEGSAEAEARLENLDQLVAAAAEHEHQTPGASLESFLDNASLLSDLDAVKADAPCLLMTLHSAKGLEFDAVFLTGLEEGLFPHPRSVGRRSALEEERRLCYVGMTRARRLLVLTYAASRAQALEREGRSPSRFL